MTNTIPNKEDELAKSYRRMRAVLKSYGFTPVNDLLAQLYAACNSSDETSRDQQIALAAHIEEIEMTLEMKGKTLLHGHLLDAGLIEGDSSVIYPSVLEARLSALKQQAQKGGK